MSIVLDGTSGITAPDVDATVNGLAYPDASSMGFRNRIINGGMVIDQRNAGASSTAVNTFTVDRFAYVATAASKGTWGQSTTAPAGFVNSLSFTSSSAYSVASGDYFHFLQPIEGFNTADLGWGTANAQAVTLSFWVRSSLTGTFGGTVQNSAANRSYPFSYSISAANTWEQKTVTIPGDTTGTWLTNNGIGIMLRLGLGTGTTKSGTANTWAAADYYAPTGAVSVVGTSGATFYITGVQLEAGSVATPFERRPYGTELALCQRYYSKMSASSAGTYAAFASGFCASATAASVYFKYPTQMRSAPTLTLSNCAVQNASGAVNAATASVFYAGSDSGYLNVATTGQTTGQGAVLIGNNNANAYLGLSSEL